MPRIETYLQKVIHFFKRFWPFLLLVGVVVHLYFRVLFFDYTFLDDNTIILDNNCFLTNIANAGQAFLRDAFIKNTETAYYRPLLTLSFMIDAHVGGTSPFVYHLTNMMLHALACCLVFVFLTTIGTARPLSILLSLLFSAHPALTQAVAWIPGRNDSLLAVFALLAMITLVRYGRTGKTKYLVFHSLSVAFGLFTKETMVFFPLCAGLWLFLDWMTRYHQGIALKPASSANPHHRMLHNHGRGKNILFLLVAWGVPFSAWFILRSIALSDPLQYTKADIFHSLMKNAQALLLHLGKFMFPFNLSVFPILRDSSLIYGIVASFLLVALFGITIYRHQKSRGYPYTRPESLFPLYAFIFGLFWFIIFLVPSFIQLDPTYPAYFLDQRIYVPIIGLLVIIAQVPDIFSIKLLLRQYVWVLVGIVIYVFAIINEGYVSVFSGRIPFWENAASHSPHHSLARNNLGAMYYLDGKLDMAEKEYIAALQLNPAQSMAHNNLGLIYQARGEYAKAEEEYQKELAMYPRYDKALINWGTLCNKTNRKKDAEALWKKTLEFYPDHIEAMKNLVTFYQENGDSVNAHFFNSELKKKGIQY